MRNLVLVLLAVLAVPAFAAPSITLEDLGSGQVAVKYATDGNLISGMGLKVTITGSTVASFANGSTKYWVHPSNIIIDDVNGVVDEEGSPAVEGDVTGLSAFTLEYGALYDRNDAGDTNKPDPAGTLCTFTVAGNCTVTVDSNTVQGGVVTEDLAAFTTLGDTLAVTVSTPCPGDANGDRVVGLADFIILKDSYGQSGSGLSADFNGDGSVGLADFIILKDNYGKTCS